MLTIDADGLRAAVNGLTEDGEAERLLGVCAAMIEAEVEDADSIDDATHNEAAIRLASWLRSNRQILGQKDIHSMASAGSPMRLSGARAMLAPYLDLGIG